MAGEDSLSDVLAVPPTPEPNPSTSQTCPTTPRPPRPHPKVFDHDLYVCFISLFFLRPHPRPARPPPKNLGRSNRPRRPQCDRPTFFGVRSHFFGDRSPRPLRNFFRPQKTTFQKTYPKGVQTPHRRRPECGGAQGTPRVYQRPWKLFF